MASGSNNLTSYKAKQIIGSGVAASPSGALLLTGEHYTGNTWLYHYGYGGTTNPWGIFHDTTAAKLIIKGSGTDSVWIKMDTGDTYILGKVGIGYDPNTTGNNYKLYVDGTAYFNIGTSDGSNGKKFVIYGNSRYLAFGGGGIQAYTSADAETTLYLNYYGGTTYIGANNYIVGSVGIGYNPDTSGNTYKLYVNGSTNITGTTTFGDYLYRAYTASGQTPMIWMNSSDFDNYLWQISSGTANGKQYYGYALKYTGTGSGVANYLQLIADNQNGTDVIAIGVNQSGQIGIGANASTDYRLYVSGTSYFSDTVTHNGDIVFVSTGGSGTTGTSKKITWSGSTDAADIYYYVPSSDQGNLIINTRDDTNCLVAFAYNGTIKAYINNSTPSFYPAATNTGTIGTSTYEWGNTYTRIIYARHFDASYPFTTDRNMYYGYNKGANHYFYSMDGTTRTHLATLSTDFTVQNGYLKSTKNSNTVTIGSQNTSWCHFDNSANIPFYFGKNIHVNSQLIIYNTGTKLYNNYLEFAQGGGWYMSDSTWIRTVGGKSVYAGSATLRCDGSTWGGKIRLTDNWIGFYAAAGDTTTRYGYLQINSTKYYFRKENGADTYPFDFNGAIYTSGKLHVASQEDVGLNQNGAVVIGNKAGTNVGIDDNEIMARNNSAASTLYVNSEGGQVYIGGGGIYSGGDVVLAAGKRVSGNGGALYVGNSNNANWLYVQDICSQNGNDKWKITVGGAATFASVVTISYKSGTWVNSLTSSAITLTDTASSYGGWICGPTKNGRIAISTYQSSDDLLYIGYGERGRTTNSFTRSMTWNGANGRLTTASVANAIWNDYAECRVADTIEPGYCITETQSGKMTKTNKRLMPGCKLISDTYGVIMGETPLAQTPIAVAGRVLAYTYRDRNDYSLGAAVCSAPNGTVDIMTRDEIIMYPERIIGTVSEIPDYEIWKAGEQGEKEIQVNNRIWIYVK